MIFSLSSNPFLEIPPHFALFLWHLDFGGRRERALLELHCKPDPDRREVRVTRSEIWGGDTKPNERLMVLRFYKDRENALPIHFGITPESMESRGHNQAFRIRKTKGQKIADQPSRLFWPKTLSQT